MNSHQEATPAVGQKPHRRRRMSRAMVEAVYSAMDCGMLFVEAVTYVRSSGFRAEFQSRAAEEIRAQAMLTRWNQEYPPGTRVALRLLLDGPEVEETTTRSQAWMISGHPSVLVEGRSGGYGLEWLRVLQKDEAFRSRTGVQ